MKKKIEFDQLVFKVVFLILVFLVGGFFASQKWQPFKTLKKGLDASKEIYTELIQQRPKLLEKIQYPGDGVTTYDESKSFQGLTLIQGIFAEGVKILLIDMHGAVLNSWDADFFKVWPNPDHVDPIPNRPLFSQQNHHTQGLWLNADGSIIVNFGEKGTVKYDKCGEVIWKVDRMTHHSITVNADGSVWIPSKGDFSKLAEKYILEKATTERLSNNKGEYEDTILLVNKDGVVQKEFSILQAIFDAGMEPDLYDINLIKPTDPTHVNDIEVVTDALSAKISGVNTGDLLVSIRNLHMLAIFDQLTGKIKWSQRGPWLRQHDVDITSDGNLEVFNNGSESLYLNRVAGSNITWFDPESGMSRIEYPLQKNGHFFSEIMGTHQLLPNGNRLISETLAGRVFEVNPKGETVWEYVKAYDEAHAALIEGALRYSNEYVSASNRTCN